MRLTDLDTPALLLDLDAFNRNLRAMMDFLGDGPCGLRPHFKAHRTPEISRRQLAAGAHGFTCAKLAEAERLADEGLDHLLIANQVVGEQKWRRLARLAERVEVICAVDHPVQLAGIARAAAAVGSRPGVLIEVDVGMSRCGVPPGLPALELARRISETPQVAFRGVMGYEGHLVLSDPTSKPAAVRAALRQLTDTADLLRDEGLPVEIVSSGGTGSYVTAARCPGITELQCGTYAVMDLMFSERAEIGLDYAMTVLTTVISRPAPARAITDAGMKALHPYGGASKPLDRPGVEVAGLSAEHGSLRLSPEAQDLQIGDKLRLVPYYTDGTVNLHDYWEVVQGEEAVDRWPISGRNCSR